MIAGSLVFNSIEARSENLEEGIYAIELLEPTVTITVDRVGVPHDDLLALVRLLYGSEENSSEGGRRHSDGEKEGDTLSLKSKRRIRG